MNTLKIILASASPRRRQFLQEWGLPHQVRTSQVDESPIPGEAAPDLAARLALAKARYVANRLGPTEKPVLVIGADTVVAQGGDLLGKPADPDEAIAMLRRLRWGEHQVHSALALLVIGGSDARQEHAWGNNMQVRVNTTSVAMRAYSDGEIEQYVASGDPMDKAGAYALQNRTFNPVHSLVGCPAGVMGLCLRDLYTMLEEAGMLPEHGVTLQADLAPVCRCLTGFSCCLEGEGLCRLD